MNGRATGRRDYGVSLVHSASPTDAYLICGTPRTGSTLLCSLMRSTGVAGRPESYFRAPDEQRWAARWGIPLGHDGRVDPATFISAAVGAGTTPNGVFSARIMWGTMDELVAQINAARSTPSADDLEALGGVFGHPRFIHLTRDDVVAQAVSWARAEQSGYWQDGDRAAPGWTPHFDRHQIERMIETIHAHNDAWRSWFAVGAVQPHHVRYEELTSDPRGTVLSALAFLGLDAPPDWKPASEHRQQADQLNADWIAAYRHLG